MAASRMTFLYIYNSHLNIRLIVIKIGKVLLKKKGREGKKEGKEKIVKREKTKEGKRVC